MHKAKKENAPHSSVNVLSSKVLTGDTVSTSPTSIAKGAPSFLSYFDLPLCSQVLYRLSYPAVVKYIYSVKY